jgi:NAD(P)-dependent dehydrogenase (short-subunit alcohol dehydrogenase family)
MSTAHRNSGRRQSNRRKLFDPRGAICVVTGASSGLGRRFCVDLADRGALVFGLARRTELLQSLRTDLLARSPGSAAIRCDVSDADSFISVLEAIESEQGRIDLLVNCAGAPEPPEAGVAGGARTAVAAYRSLLDTNFTSAVAGTLAVLPGTLLRQRGVVVNVSSDSARAPGPDEPAYCASKAAVSAFTESLALSIDGTGVRLHILYPGWVPTAMGLGALDAGMPTPPKFVRRTEEQVSRLMLDRIGTSRIDIDAAIAARFAPVARSIAPGAYKRGVLSSSGH